MPGKKITITLGNALRAGALTALLAALAGCSSGSVAQPTVVPTNTLAPVSAPTIPPTDVAPTQAAPTELPPTVEVAATPTVPVAADTPTTNVIPSPTTASEQTVAPTVASNSTPVPVGDLQWKQVGLAGNNVTGLSFIAQGSNVVVLAAGPKGIWTGTYNFTTWDKHDVSLATEARNADGVVASADVMYITSGTGCPSGLPAARSRSIDGGKTWEGMQGEAMVIAVANATTAYGAKCSGLNKTTDSGATWTNLSVTTQSSDPISLAASPDGQTVFAAYVSEGGTGQIMESKDGGATWSDVTPKNVPAEGFVGPADLTFVPGSEGRPADAGLYLTNNDGIWLLPLEGGDWKLLKKPALPDDPAGGYSRHTALFVDTAYSADYDKPGPIIYTARAHSGDSSEVGQGVFRSADMGATWQNMGKGLDRHIVNGLALIPYDSGSGRVETLLAATDDGIWAITMPPGK